MKKKKLKLEQLKVNSLITDTTGNKDGATIKGGHTAALCTVTNPMACPTQLPIFCNLKTANCTKTHFPNCLQFG